MEENRDTTLYPDVCVCCGKPVPEGRMICRVCETEGVTIPNEADKPKKGLRKILKLTKEQKHGPQA